MRCYSVTLAYVRYPPIPYRYNMHIYMPYIYAGTDLVFDACTASNESHLGHRRRLKPLWHKDFRTFLGRNKSYRLNPFSK